jgi:hypothetical protein
MWGILFSLSWTLVVEDSLDVSSGSKPTMSLTQGLSLRSWRTRQSSYPNESRAVRSSGGNAIENATQLFPRSKYRRRMEDESFSSWIENIASRGNVDGEQPWETSNGR